jgi:hypothetical protein
MEELDVDQLGYIEGLDRRESCNIVSFLCLSALETVYRGLL